MEDQHQSVAFVGRSVDSAVSNSTQKNPPYQPLSKETREIRLLEITHVSDPDSGKVNCVLHTVPLDEDLVFSALSYVWGDPTDREAVTVNGQEVLITKSLATALRHVRDQWRAARPDCDPASFRLWADGLCIDQSDLVERGHQVKLMGQIYSQADLTLAWLGSDGDGDIGLALETTSLVSNSRWFEGKSEGSYGSGIGWLLDCPQLLEEVWKAPSKREPGMKNRWNALEVLFKLSYWRRVWIVQEVVLSRDVLLCCPSQNLNFNKLVIFTKVVRDLNFEPETDKGFSPSTVPLITWACIRKFLDDTFPIYALSAIRAARQRSHGYSVWSIAFYGWRCQASDIRDHVFGLLGLSGIGIEPDYTKPAADVLAEFVSAWLAWPRDTGPVQILARPLGFLTYAQPAAATRAALPSWVPFPTYDGVIDMEGGTEVRFSAADDAICGPRLRLRLFSSPSLCLPGVRLGTISRLAENCDFDLELDARFARLLRQLPLRTQTLNVIYRLMFGSEVGAAIDVTDQAFIAFICKAVWFLSIATGGPAEFALNRGADQEPNRQAFASIGLPVDTLADFTSSFCRIFCPGLDLEEVAFSRLIRDVVKRRKPGGFHYITVCRELALMLRRASLGEMGGTDVLPHVPDGSPRLVLVEMNARVGDMVCAVHGRRSPLVLRRLDNRSWALVGSCRMAELRDGVMMESLEIGADTQVEQFQIQ